MNAARRVVPMTVIGLLVVDLTAVTIAFAREPWPALFAAFAADAVILSTAAIWWLGGPRSLRIRWGVVGRAGLLAILAFGLE